VAKSSQRDAEVEYEDALIVAGPAALAARNQLAQLGVDARDARELALVQACILDLPAIVGQHEVGRRNRLVGDIGVVIERDREAAGSQPVRLQRRAARIFDGVPP
jgi:hypothetical protein